MARKVIYQLIDDIDQTELAEGEGETVSFGLDGKSYEIDLNSKNATKLRSQLNRYVEAARQAKPATTGTTSTNARKRPDLAQIRAWARENGHQVSERGRVASEIIKRYENHVG
ncbi:hypothetical protein C5B85_08880 [Pseudoclavibacter sp. AY1F1]|uniref:histone-like nucleoid-structuring protein Lsr2 n=1 Tax=Pseudoclavibacter sp. AY1F1 TaxID=2080583 RepID=UPI000CE75685|nr:Lsr2 family protein [Pseudoclavibacter sp. AY1F1]PPF44846.1 hypothetical protein C5B85_08880 [Pseudoclavibacter sp. AY1F1]